MILFMLFGLVQLAEAWPLKGRSRQAELFYIFLSLFAKSLLGGALFANVIFV